MAAHEVRVDDADGLHEGIHRRGADERKTLLAQGFRQRLALVRDGGDLGVVRWSRRLGGLEGPHEVDEATLVAHAAVSEPTARAMALGVQALLGADVGVATTGIAGPGGGTADKPVGLVHFAAQRAGYDAIVERHVFPGDRDQIRRLTVVTALAMVAALAEQ